MHVPSASALNHAPSQAYQRLKTRNALHAGLCHALGIELDVRALLKDISACVLKGHARKTQVPSEATHSAAVPPVEISYQCGKRMADEITFLHSLTPADASNEASALATVITLPLHCRRRTTAQGILQDADSMARPLFGPESRVSKVSKRVHWATAECCGVRTPKTCARWQPFWAGATRATHLGISTRKSRQIKQHNLQGSFGLFACGRLTCSTNAPVVDSWHP